MIIDTYKYKKYRKIKTLGKIWENSYLESIRKCKIETNKNINVIIQRHKKPLDINDLIEVEKQGDILFPNSNYMKYYENKENLFYNFKKNGVKIPETWFCNNLNKALKIKNELTFPIIIKKPYSCYSDGISQCLDSNDYDIIITDFFKTNNECIIQRKISFTKEARLTYVGNKIIHGYYRIKENKKIVSGCSAFGSICSFDIDLNNIKYNNFINDFIKKTGFDMGGIDIVWENNDETSEPFVLEVSPIFDVNPSPPKNFNDSYKFFKKTKQHDILKKQLIQKITDETVEYIVKKNSKPVIYCDIDSTINNHQKRIKKWFKDGKIHKNATIYSEIMQDEVLPNALESNHKLYEKYNIYFITARKSFPNAYKSTKDWLDHNDFRYDKIILTNSLKNKIKFLKNDKYLKCFIDDCTTNHHLNIPELDISNINKIRNENIPLIIFKNNWVEITEKLLE